MSLLKPRKSSIVGSGNMKTHMAVLTGNRREKVGIGFFRCFPFSSSEALHPQKVKKVPK